MFVPMPVLIVIGVAVLLLVGWALRASRGRDPLMGGQAPVMGGQAPARRAPVAATAVPGPVSGAAAAVLPPEVEEIVRALLTDGRKIEAIKLVREATHIGLKEAKDLVESME